MDNFFYGMLTVWLPFSALNLYSEVRRIKYASNYGVPVFSVNNLTDCVLTTISGPINAFLYARRDAW